MKIPSPVLVLVIGAVALAAGCGGGSGGSSGGSSGGASGTPQHGGTVVIDRSAESESMDKENVFDNESIWILEQIMQPLYTVSPNGKGVVPYLAKSYTLSPNKMTYTFHLRPGVKFSDGKLMTSADVKFSIDQTRKAAQGWGYLDAAIKDIKTPDPETVVIDTKYPWAPFLADIALFANGIIPNNYDGQTAKEFYSHPIGTGPFMWGHWQHGVEIELNRNPHYWQKGLPYLDHVIWKTVTDTNTRELQLEGGQAQVDEFPDWQTVNTLQSTPGVTMTLFNSTRTDYMMMNEQYKPLADVHVRRAISLALDRNAMIKSVLFGHGKAANSFMPPQVPYYDPNSPGLQYNVSQAKQEMAESAYPKGFTVDMLIGAGVANEKSIGQIVQAELQKIGIKVVFKPTDPSIEFQDEQQFKYQLGLSYWTMDIADPDELVTFAVDPGSGAKSFYTDYDNANVVKWTHEAERTFSSTQRQKLYSEIQAQAAHDAFMAFLYYSPYAYAYSNKVHGFYVYPTGNYHMENVWLSH
ncbi:MAG TPA: ABC transporter substrate-binding protein [Gaiellales bacterium]